VSDVSGDIRTLLEEKAEEMRLEPRIPGSVIKRARRRRVITAAVAGTVTLAAAVGFYAGARTLLQETSGRDGRVQPAGTGAETYPLIYPPTEEQLDNTLAEVEQGSMPLWLSPRGVAELFAVNVLGWEPNDVEVEEVNGELRMGEPLIAVVSNPSLSQAVGSEDPIRTTLSLIRLPYEVEMYAVLAAQAEGLTIEPDGFDQSVPGQESLAFRGRLDFAATGATVELSFDRGDPVSAPAEGEFVLEGHIPGGLQPWTLITIAVKDDSGHILTLTSARMSTAVTTQSPDGSGVMVEPVPARVADTQQAIHDAAVARDWESLRTLIPERGFTFSFGLARDPIAYWQSLEQEGEPILSILATLLEGEHGRFRGTFIWPAPAAEDPEDWDESDLEVLREIHTERDIRQFQQADLYFGWRVGIERDGTWVYFVAGD
jgi:hypothetical protein